MTLKAIYWKFYCAYCLVLHTHQYHCSYDNKIYLSVRPDPDRYSSIRWPKILYLRRPKISCARRLQEVCYIEALLWCFGWSFWTNPHLSTGCRPKANAGLINIPESRHEILYCNLDCNSDLSCVQVQNKQPLNANDAFCIRGTFQGLLLIIRCQGWRQLFAGLSLNYVKVIEEYGWQILYSFFFLLNYISTMYLFLKIDSVQVVPSVAIGFTTYDMMKILLGVPPRERAHPSTGNNNKWTSIDLLVL